MSEKLFKMLGVQTEEEAASVLANYNTFATDILNFTGAKDLKEALSKVGSHATVARQVESLTGREGGDAVAVATAWKTSAGEVDKARAEAAELRKNTVDAQASAAIDTAVSEGRLEPAKRGDLETLYAQFGINALNTALNALPRSGPAPSTSTPSQPKTGSQSSTLTDAERRVALAMGKEPDFALQARNEWDQLVGSDGKTAHIQVRKA